MDDATHLLVQLAKAAVLVGGIVLVWWGMTRNARGPAAARERLTVAGRPARLLFTPVTPPARDAMSADLRAAVDTLDALGFVPLKAFDATLHIEWVWGHATHAAMAVVVVGYHVSVQFVSLANDGTVCLVDDQSSESPPDAAPDDPRVRRILADGTTPADDFKTLLARRDPHATWLPPDADAYATAAADLYRRQTESYVLSLCRAPGARHADRVSGAAALDAIALVRWAESAGIDDDDLVDRVDRLLVLHEFVPEEELLRRVTGRRWFLGRAAERDLASLEGLGLAELFRRANERLPEPKRWTRVGVVDAPVHAEIYERPAPG
jgi:hypothetical protein